ncbi:MAG: anti-sigma F factor [Clostridia bacterium]|nr:anti-sigma F factor [Clostridia bacterium]
MKNQMELIFPSLAENEAFARMVISAFLVGVNPTLSVVSEIRTAVSEAVTNAVVHAYAGTTGRIILRARLTEEHVEIEIEDFGRGIENVEQAMQPFFTTQPDQERTGMGFALMQSFMDEVSVESSPGNGTAVKMIKRLEDAHA